MKIKTYKTIILLVILFGCKTLREEHRFRVFENKVLRKIFGAKRNKITGEWRSYLMLSYKALYSSPNIIRR